MHPTQRECRRSPALNTEILAASLSLITRNAVGAHPKKYEVSANDTYSQSARGANHPSKWLEPVRIAICETACAIIRKHFLSTASSRGVIQVVPRVKQFELRIAKRSGLPSEIASALWLKGVRIQAFSGEIREGQDIFHVAVDKAALAKQTFIENGWQAIEERPHHLHT